jgi:hypothetical protein
MKVHVIMKNDFPHLVYSGEARAQRFVEDENKKEQIVATQGGRRAFWHLHTFEVQ